MQKLCGERDCKMVLKHMNVQCSKKEMLNTRNISILPKLIFNAILIKIQTVF